jgi:hypothetical protein
MTLSRMKVRFGSEAPVQADCLRRLGAAREGDATEEGEPLREALAPIPSVYVVTVILVALDVAGEVGARPARFAGFKFVLHNAQDVCGRVRQHDLYLSAWADSITCGRRPAGRIGS